MKRYQKLLCLFLVGFKIANNVGTLQKLNCARAARCVVGVVGGVGVVGIMLCGAANSAWAITCTITAQGVVFGNYDVFNAANLDGTGNVAITCDLISAYSLALSPRTGTFAVRNMASGSNRLNYNLYTDATRTTIWGMEPAAPA